MSAEHHKHQQAEWTASVTPEEEPARLKDATLWIIALATPAQRRGNTQTPAAQFIRSRAVTQTKNRYQEFCF